MINMMHPPVIIMMIKKRLLREHCQALTIATIIKE